MRECPDGCGLEISPTADELIQKLTFEKAVLLQIVREYYDHLYVEGNYGLYKPLEGVIAQFELGGNRD